MDKRELRTLALAFVRDELPREFQDCIRRVLSGFPDYLKSSGRLSDYEVEDLFSEHYSRHIKEYLIDFIEGKIFMSVEQIPGSSIAIRN